VGYAVQEDESVGKAAFSVRAILLGAFMCLVIGVIGPYWGFYLHSSALFPDYSVGGAVFFLFLLVLLLNGVLALLWRRLAFRPGEFVVVTAMMLVGGAITTMGLTGYLVPNISAPYYLADHINQWEDNLWPHLPRWAAPLDADGGTNAIQLFYSGLSEQPDIWAGSWGPSGLAQTGRNFGAVTSAMPWGTWLRPLALWAVFLVALYACMISLMAIVRKQWVDYERLTFPIAQVPQELCAAAAAPWKRASIFRSLLFWGGMAVPFVVGSLRGAHHYYDWVPTIPVATSIRGMGPMSLQIRLSFAVLGYAFLVPNHVAFSLWSLNLISFAFRSVLKAHGLEMQENLGLYGAVQSPLMAHQGMGAMIVFAVASVYFARRHLKRVVLCAVARDRRKLLGLPLGVACALLVACALYGTLAIPPVLLFAGVGVLVVPLVWLAYGVAARRLGGRAELANYDAGEPSSYGVSLAVLVVSLAVMTAWLVAAGLSLFFAVMFLGAALLIFYGLTRLIAQCGVSVTTAPMIAPVFITSTFGGANISTAGIAVLTQGWTWCSDIRTSVMSSSAHGMYLARRKAGGLLWLLVLAALITFFVSSLATVWLGYRYGAANLESWYFIKGPVHTYNWGLKEVSTNQPPNIAGHLWTLVGGVIMVGLTVAHRCLFWWPFHPVGFIVCSVDWMDRAWFTVFLAWALKAVITKAGGNKALRHARHFFLGMILGHFSVCGFWAIVDTITQSTGNSLFWF